MPRSSTLLILLATFALYAMGLSGALPVGIFLAMALEMVIWKRTMDQARELRLARVARPVRGYRSRR
jgi:hypothetical protein